MKIQERVTCPTCSREVTITATSSGPDGVAIGASKVRTVKPWTPIVITRRHKDPATKHECAGGVIREYVRRDPELCEACDCADPTALAGLAAECDCECHR